MEWLTERDDGAGVQAVRGRGAHQERVHARQAALSLPGLRAELHRHAATRDALAGEGDGGAALCQRPVHEPYGQAAWRVHAIGDDLDRAVRQGSRAEARARRPCSGHRARRDVALSKKKTNKLWIWKAWDRASGRLVDWECGGRDRATLDELLARVKRWEPRLYCTDDWAAYQEAIPQGRLYVGKDETHGLERNHARQRHWLARFRRRSIVVSKAKRMVDVSIALFARFGGNDRVGELTAMLA